MKNVLAIIVLVLLVAASGVAVVWWGRRETPVRARVERGVVREYVDERGKTRLPHAHLITMPFSARIEPIEVQEGDAVTQGQVVARVAGADLENELAQAQAAVQRLAASIDETRDTSVESSTKRQAVSLVESMVSTVAAAEARTIASKSRLDYSEIFLGRTRRLAQTGAETQDSLDRAELQYIEDQIAYRQDALAAEALKAMQAATNLLPQIVMDYIGRKGLTAAVLEKEKLEAEARLRQAELRSQRGVMTSPVDGVVLERAESNERSLPAGTLLLRIGQLEELEVEADILSEDVVRVREGASVEIYGASLNATSGAGVPGVVRRVYPAGFTKISSLGVEQQRVTVIVQFAPDARGQLPPLGVDYRVRVRILTAESPAALRAPRSALLRDMDGGWQVFVIRQGVARRQAVQVGLMNDDVVEVLEGIQEGDQVILAPETTLRDGALVRAL